MPLASSGCCSSNSVFSVSQSRCFPCLLQHLREEPALLPTHEDGLREGGEEGWGRQVRVLNGFTIKEQVFG